MDRNRVILPEGLVAAIDKRFGARGRSRFVEEAVARSSNVWSSRKRWYQWRES